MGILADLTASFEAYRDDVKSKVAELGQKIDDLQKHIDDGGINVQPLLDEIKAAKDELDGVAATPVPVVPATPPSGTPTSEPTTGTGTGS